MIVLALIWSQGATSLRLLPKWGWSWSQPHAGCALPRGLKLWAGWGAGKRIHQQPQTGQEINKIQVHPRGPIRENQKTEMEPEMQLATLGQDPARKERDGQVTGRKGVIKLILLIWRNSASSSLYIQRCCYDLWIPRHSGFQSCCSWKEIEI